MTAKTTPRNDDQCPSVSERAGGIDGDHAANMPGRSSQKLCQAPTSSARNLLLGLLALQNNFIDRNALVAAFTSWIADRSRGLGSLLVELRVLSSHRLELLESLVDEHIQQHGNDPERSLAALRPPDSLHEELSRLADSEIQESLAHLTSRGGRTTRITLRKMARPRWGTPRPTGTGSASFVLMPREV